MRAKTKTIDTLRQFLTVKNETLTSGDLYFYGDIVSDWWGAWEDSDQYPEAVRDFLKGCEGKNLNIYINSGGGSVFAGIAIYNMLKRHKGYKTVYVDGMAASIASVIALVGDRIVVPSNAFIMIHKPFAWGEGNADELRKIADDLDAVEGGIMNVYRDNLAEGADIEDVRRMVAAETWLNGEEAAKYFRVEVGAAKEYAAKVTDAVRAYKNIPNTIIKSAEAGEPALRDDNTANEQSSLKLRDKITRTIISATTKGV